MFHRSKFSLTLQNLCRSLRELVSFGDVEPTACAVGYLHAARCAGSLLFAIEWPERRLQQAVQYLSDWLATAHDEVMIAKNSMAKRSDQDSLTFHPRDNSRGSGKSLSFHPATASRWGDIEELFGERGACGGCWCMFWRVPRKQFDQGKGQETNEPLRKL